MTMLKELGKHETSYVMIGKDEYESMKRTIDVLGDKEIMEQIRASKNAKSKPWKTIKKELAIYKSSLCFIASISIILFFSL